MEVATRPNFTPPLDAGPEPAKLTIDRFVEGNIACMRFGGTIDEAFEGKKLAATVKAHTLVLDLGGVKKISSFGIREWVDFVSAAGKQVKQLLLVECAPKVVDQLNMVANFAGPGRVFSFYAPFRCDYCDSEHRALLQIDRDWDAIRAMKLPDKPCPSCSEAMYFDEDPTTFFSYVIGQDRFDVEPDIAAFLASKLDYGVSDGRKLRVDKAIEGRVTLVRLAGDLDGGFPREKLAEGLEGTVIVDVGGIGRIEPAGAAEWRSFAQQVAPLVEAIYLVGVTPPFLEKLGRRDDLGEKGAVLSLVLPYACAMCASTTGQPIEVDQHHDVLKFATAPDLKCAQCKSPLTCVAAESVMALLPTLPAAVVSTELKKTIKELREKKPVVMKKPSTVMTAQPTARGGGGLWIPFAAAILAVALGAGAFLAWRAWSGDAAGVELGKVVASSPGGRPAWIGADAPGKAYCAETPDKGLACVGVSTVSGSQADAEEEAADAAHEAIADAIAARVADPKWKAVVAPIWAEARQARLAALERDPDSAQARRLVRDARRQVAAALRHGPASKLAAPGESYWEEHAGKRFVAFSRAVVAAADLKTALAAYTATATVQGATVVPAFPLVAWRWPEATRGVIVVGLAAGKFKELGLVERYVVLEIGGKDVDDPAALARLTGEELTRLDATGGTFELEVQADEPRPRRFATLIKGRPVTEEGSGSGRDRDRDRGSSGKRTPAGGVNVWDRYDRGKKPNPDDPTQ